MADTFEITGKNTISFAAGNRWQLTADSRPRGMSKPLSDQAVLNELRNLPLEIRPHALQHGLSKIAFTFDINGSTGADMEDALHDLLETLEDGALYIATREARGTKAVLHYKKAGAAADSYKTIFYGEFDEAGARQVLGPEQMNNNLIAMPLTLYCEPNWHPAATTNLVNAVTVYNHDDADVGHDNFVDIAAANIKGDVEAPIKLKIETVLNPPYYLQHAMVFRRTTGTPSSFDHTYEAEEANVQFNWADAVDTNASAGNKVSNSAHDSGYVQFDPIPAAGVSANELGDFHIMARMKTNDAINTKVRCTLYNAGSDALLTVGNWVWFDRADYWQWLDLGPFNISKHEALLPSDLRVDIEYKKDIADTIEFDWWMWCPVDESLGQLEAPTMYTSIPKRFYKDDTGDFRDTGVGIDTNSDWVHILRFRGSPRLTVRPAVVNRYYFKFLHTTHYQDYVHEYTNYCTITIDYLPQYISPLE